MQNTELIPDLFRTEYRKIVSVLCRLLGVDHIEIAQDIASDTFVSATEVWGSKGLPENPTAWLYLVAKNKTKDYLKRNALFAKTISKEIRYTAELSEEVEIDLSIRNINDSQLAMIFVVCHPCNPPEAQIGLALNLLCGFNAEEIASAFLKNRTTVYKQLQRAKEKLRTTNIRIEQPTEPEINERLPSVLMTLYLLFNEGYYSSSQNIPLRKNLCLEAIRLTELLAGHPPTDQPATNALLSLMCFHSSRFDARLNQNGEIILYNDQDTSLWDQERIAQGEFFLNRASHGDTISKYHVEAGIAYWHTIKSDDKEKWENVLFLYDQLLLIEYSPVAALNRTYALAKVHGKNPAIAEAEKINLTDNHLYHTLLGELYSGLESKKAVFHLEKALLLAKSPADKMLISNKILVAEGRS